VTKWRCRLTLRVAVLTWENVRHPFGAVQVASLVLLLNACSSELVIGSWTCGPSSSSVGLPDSGTTDGGKPFEFPWSTGFEDGFCGYLAGGGSCYSTGSATYKIVDAPVHSGHYAAAFNVVGDGTSTSTDSRCFREGSLPQQAYYGAWYCFPTHATNTGLWNLVHFQGGDARGQPLHGLWDISVLNNDTGGLRLIVFDFLDGSTHDTTGAPAVPIGSWFHIQMFLKRASDATGEVNVFQNGTSLLHLTNLVTDDSTFGQWYVGNLATNLNPAESTLYVDDVGIGDAL
jgi:hypothetical protein